MTPSMAIHLVRHADAGNRPQWQGDDEDRPLNERGMRQAHTIAGLLAPTGVKRILTSRYARCVQTVEPIAASPHLELAGCYAWSADKVGRDVGELCGLQPLGITPDGEVEGLDVTRHGEAVIADRDAVPIHERGGQVRDPDLPGRVLLDSW